MDRGLYAAASSGLRRLRQLDIVNNNLANVSTPGFKKQMLVNKTQDFDETLAASVAANDPYARADHDRVHGTVTVQTITDFSQGSIESTGRDLDVALRHPLDFFVVQTPDGVQYTRAGNFALNAEGQLTTQDGLIVTGDGGAMAAPGAGARIRPDGSLVYEGGDGGRLQVVRFEDPSVLERVGGSRFKVGGRGAEPQQVEPEIVARSLELSNTTTIGSVIELISAQRAFEMYTKTAKAIDEMNQTAVQQVGRTR